MVHEADKPEGVINFSNADDPACLVRIWMLSLRLDVAPECASSFGGDRLEGANSVRGTQHETSVSGRTNFVGTIARNPEISCQYPRTL